ncbi:MAG: type VI secretion system baseplate subunit TssK [Acetobacteraceae bacterium]
MSWTNRVIWQEGMFLRAQHFQQQDRWIEALVQGRTGVLRPYPWGLTAFAIDRALLAAGRFALGSGAGVFEDGTLFVVPGETDHPPPLEPPATTRNALVYLATPIRQAGANEVGGDLDSEGRYGVKGFEAHDTQPRSSADAPQPAELQIGRLKLRYLLESQDRAGYHCIAVARITEVGADRRITLDDRWIPPALICAAAPPLTGLLAELTGMLNQRGEALASRLGAPGARGVAEVTDFLLLQMVNRWQKLLSHWADSGNIHPEDFYAALLQMAGEFATFTEPTRRPNTYPAYRHEDLQRSFAPVVADLRRSLSAVLETTAVAIPLQERRHGVRVGPLNDRGLLRNSNFVLSVRADVPGETLRRMFPSQVKIGAVEHITNLVNVALPGIAVRPLNVAPRQIPFYAGATYFELDRNSPHWQQMQSSGGFAIFVAGEFPNLQMELWAIRGSEAG